MPKIYLTPRTEFLATKTVADAAIPTAQKGVASGVASLDAGGIVTTSQLPPTVATYVAGTAYRKGDLITDGVDTYRADGAITTAQATATIPLGVGDGFFVKLGGGSGSVDDNWVSEIALSNILLDISGQAITTPTNEVIHLGAAVQDKTPLKGINLATAGSKTFSEFVILYGQATDTVDASKLPFVFDTEEQARVAAGWMLQKIVTFFKNYENDTCFDQLINQFGSSSVVTNGIAGGSALPIYNNGDMDNLAFNYDSTISNNSSEATITEWFEVIVGRNRAGDKYWTFWFLPMVLFDVASGNMVYNVFYSQRAAYQTTANEYFKDKPVVRYYKNGTPATPLPANGRDLSSSMGTGLPQLTTRISNTPVAMSGEALSPIWLEPITFEMGR